MTRSKLIAQLVERFLTLSAKDSEVAVSLIIDSIGDALAHGHRIEIRGFGSFRAIYRRPRIGRNPRSGERVDVPAKYVPHFKAGMQLRERVDPNLVWV
ncbi:MAG: integration host factor subunit beta [Proteobacteria bacterium]|nr:integration host factor subunit beta [Pseudomonadota bacterium]